MASARDLRRDSDVFQYGGGGDHGIRIRQRGFKVVRASRHGRCPSPVDGADERRDVRRLGASNRFQVLDVFRRQAKRGEGRVLELGEALLVERRLEVLQRESATCM